MTAPAQVTPTNTRAEPVSARTALAVLEAWTASSTAIRTVMLGAAVCALAATTTTDVHLASGLTIAVMTTAALVDHHVRRLPDGIVLAAAAVFVLAWLPTAIIGTAPSPLGVVLGTAVFAGPLLVLHLLAPSAMGFGDVKAAAVLGLAIGAVSWNLAAWALTVAAASTALAGVALRRSTLPFGPGLVAGALSAVLAVALLGLEGIGIS